MKSYKVRRVRSIVYYFIVILSLTGCENGYAKAGPGDSRSLLIGIWECRIPYGKWTIERRIDGTFSKTGVLVRTLGKPAIPFAVTGRWQLEGKEYIEIWKKVTPADWRALNGTKKISKVLSVEPSRFARVQADSPVFIETKKKVE
jgi:hypothetical protein